MKRAIILCLFGLVACTSIFTLAFIANAAESSGYKTVNTNCHSPTSYTNEDLCCYEADAQLLCVTYTNDITTTGVGSCDNQTCTSGTNFWYCGEPYGSGSKCSYSEYTGHCDGARLIYYTTTVTNGVCSFPTINGGVQQ